MEEDVPPELDDGWEIYSAIQSGLVNPMSLDDWDKLPDSVVFQLKIIMEIMPQVAEAKSKTTVEV